MPFNNVISRTDAASLIPPEIAAEILQDVPTMNPIMRLARQLPNLATNQRRMPVMSALATAYFVTGDTSLKQTSEVNWANRFIDAEELAVIVPIPEAVLDDVSYDIWGNVKPEIERAISIAITGALLYGTNIPATWTVNLNGAAGLVAGATTAGMFLHLAAYTDLYEALLGFNGAGAAGVFSAVEANGYAVTGSIAHPSVKGALRNTRDTLGQPIFKVGPQGDPSMQAPTQYELDGTSISFPTDGSMVAASCTAIAGQWDQLVYALRQDITYKILDQAVIQDNAGNIVYNLAQQDMVALRAVIRLGFALPNPINRMNAVAATRFPFSVLVP